MPESLYMVQMTGVCRAAARGCGAVHKRQKLALMLLQVLAEERQSTRSCKQNVLGSVAAELSSVSYTCFCYYQQAYTAETLIMHCPACLESGASGPQQLVKAAD